MTMSNETVYIGKLLEEAKFNKRTFTKRQMASKFNYHTVGRNY